MVSLLKQLYELGRSWNMAYAHLFEIDKKIEAMCSSTPTTDMISLRAVLFHLYDYNIDAHVIKDFNNIKICQFLKKHIRSYFNIRSYNPFRLKFTQSVYLFRGIILTLLMYIFKVDYSMGQTTYNKSLTKLQAVESFVYQKSSKKVKEMLVRQNGKIVSLTFAVLQNIQPYLKYVLHTIVNPAAIIMFVSGILYLYFTSFSSNSNTDHLMRQKLFGHQKWDWEKQKFLKLTKHENTGKIRWNGNFIHKMLNTFHDAGFINALDIYRPTGDVRTSFVEVYYAIQLYEPASRRHEISQRIFNYLQYPFVRTVGKSKGRGVIV